MQDGQAHLTQSDRTSSMGVASFWRRPAVLISAVSVLGLTLGRDVDGSSFITRQVIDTASAS